MNLKKSLLLLILVFSLLLSGCDYNVLIDNMMQEWILQPTQPPTEPPTEPTKPAEPIIGFSAEETQSMDELVQLTAEELENHTLNYSQYNTYHYFQYLNDSEKLLYRAYEYALDEGLPYIWVDERLLLGLGRTEFQVLEFLSLDSAVVEQNIEYMLDNHRAPENGETYTTIFVEDFTQQRKKNKDKAIMQAKIVMSRLYGKGPQSKLELAEYIYDYLGDCTSYVEDVESEEYLYSILCGIESNCDGYANAFALMCSIVDVPCIEVNSNTAKGTVGHTWNMVDLDGRWVHMDASGAPDDLWSLCDNREKHWVNFGLGDALLADQVAYKDMLPACPVGLAPVLHLRSQMDEGFIYRVRGEFESNNREFAIVLLDEGDMDEQTIDELVAILYCDLYYVHYQTAEGKTAYFLFNDSN